MFDFLVLGLMTVLSGGLSYWAREAWSLGWYSERSGVGWIANAIFLFSLLLWLAIIFNFKMD
jgi:hypothetical protein